MDYFQASNPFFLAHLLTWAVALDLLWKMHSTARGVGGQVAPLRRIADSEVRKFSYPIEKFDAPFDFCSGCFILIGLIGTITGFFRALPHLSDPQYDFHDFRQALATSAFGIVWAIVLNLVLVSYQRFFVAPLMQGMLEKVSVDQLAQSLAQSLEKFGSQIATELQKGLSDFSFGATRVADATQKLASAADVLGNNLTQATKQAEGAAAKVSDVLAKVVKLPEDTARNLSGVFQQITAFYEKALAEQKSALEAIAESNRTILTKDVARLSTSYHETAQNLVKEQAATLQKSLADFQKNLHQLQQSFTADLQAQDKSIQASLSAAGDLLSGLARDIESKFNQSYDNTLGRLAASNAEAIEKMLIAATRASDAVSQQAGHLRPAVDSLQLLVTELRQCATSAQAGSSATHAAGSSCNQHSTNGSKPPQSEERPGLWARLTRRA